MILGLFCGRWTLMSLGEIDYGLMGLIGGLITFVTFFNGLLASAVSRFYAVSVGASHKEGNAEQGLEECRKWFNTALSLHTVVPLVLVVIGYPAGIWAINDFLTIPLDRIGSCIWVWRFTCISCFIGMVNVPFAAMYNAKQEIAELTVYSIATATLNVLFLYYMITHPRVWLTPFAFWTMALGVVPQLIITWRAVSKYPECRFRRKYLWDMGRIKELLIFAFARFWTALAGMISAQGNSILVNKYLGPQFNASVAVGNTVAAHASTLSGSLSGAFSPVIGNKAGEGKEDEVRKFAFRTCRLGSLLMLIFALPLAIEIEEVLRLWLKIPPEGASIICVAVLIDLILERMTEGHWMAILAVGRGVPTYSAYASLIGISRLAIAWLAFALGYGLPGLCVALVAARCLAVVIRLILGRKFVCMSAIYWLKSIFLPIAVTVLISAAFGILPALFVKASFARICATTLLCEMFFSLLSWALVISSDEKEFLKQRVGTLRQKLFRGAM